MTLKEKVEMENPAYIDPDSPGGVIGCPSDYAYARYLPQNMDRCPVGPNYPPNPDCERCWNQEIPGTEPTKKEDTEPNIHTPTAEACMKFMAAFVNVGFTRDEAFTMLLSQLQLVSTHSKSDLLRQAAINNFRRRAKAETCGGADDDT